MQLPVVVFRLDEKNKTQKLFIVEKQCGIDYRKLVNLVHKFTLETKLETEGIAKETLRNLCKLATTEADRKLLKFAVCQASKYSNKEARQKLGVHNVSKLKAEIEIAVEEAEKIRKEVSDLAAIREKSALRCLGLYSIDESDSSDSEKEGETDESDSDIDWQSESASDTESDINNQGASEIENAVPSLPKSQIAPFLPNHNYLLDLLRESSFNWFCFVQESKLLMRECDNEVIDQVLIDFSQSIHTLELNETEKERTEMSRQAYLNSERVAELNNTGFTDSESDDPED
ncbi:Hypothetical predicted protein [Paramuricea clavata]|uniref:Uncharacterized protein n=1 Tax=Paramuricea clavata TaxID=317549 RepID=A0A7D9DVJ4_PARCT|nr:Hypothetical predicted protein [Paramuricea clavata]